jgi:hypothetical protein
MHRAVGYDGIPAITNVSVERGPRMTINDIIEMNHDTHRCALVIERDEGYSRYRGAFPVSLDYPISSDDYLQRSEKIPWPTAPGETIDILGFWPEANSQTVVVPEEPSFASLSLDDLEKLAQKCLS